MGGGFVTDQDPGEAFHSKLAATGLTQDQFSDDEYLTSGGAIVDPDLEDPFQIEAPAQSPPEAAFQKSAYRYDREFEPPAQSPPEATFQRSAYRYDRDFQPPAPSPPETALPKGDYRYDREETTNEPFQFEPPAKSPPEAAFQKSDYRYDRAETTQTERFPAQSPPEAALPKGDYRYDREETSRRRRDRSPQLQGLHRADIPLVGNFGSPCDSTPYAVERVWGFLHDRGQLLRTRELLALQLIRPGTWRTLVSGYKKKSRDPAVFETLPPTTTPRPQGTSTTSGGSGGRRPQE